MSAETIIINGNFITVDRERPRAQAVAIREGRFTAVGTNEEVLADRGQKSEIIDLQGQTVVPGFNDSHLHLLWLGKAREQVELVPVRSRQELIRAGKDFLTAHPEIKWLQGRGWNQEKFSDKTMPTRHDLDQISREIPVLFTRVCGHISVANSKALELAAIGKNPVQPEGGQIDLDEVGEPTGILRERANFSIRNLIDEDTVEDYQRLLKKGAEEAISLGLTSVQSDDFGETETMTLKLTAYQKLINNGEFPLRVSLQVRLSELEEMEEYLELRQDYDFPENTVSYGPIKLMLDGSLGGRTAALLEPYSDNPSAQGVMTMSQQKIDQLLNFIHQQGQQAAAHAIGDRAIKMLLDGYRQMLENKPAADARPRIIHAQITNRELFNSMKELGVICDIQPVFVSSDLHIVEDRVGRKRAESSYAWKTMQEMGIPTAGGSDCPVESCDPLLGIYTAVNRQDLSGFPEEGFQPEQKLSVEEALELFTLGSAYASFDEEVKGTISPGKLADFVLLSDDITEIATEEIKEVRVMATYIGGKLVYQAE